MAIIKTKKGQEILIDDEDFERLNQYKWHTTADGYVVSSLPLGGCIYLTHLLLEPAKESYVSFANRNPLDCRKSNLVHRSKKHNLKKIGASSKYFGVYLVKASRKNQQDYVRWQAAICLKSKVIHIGVFRTQNKAALAYNEKAIELYGEHAVLNKVEGCNG